MLRHCFAALLLIAALLPARAQVPPSAIGVIVMHGKGGAPGGIVSGLADTLAREGFIVANVEMPWSGRRTYDVTVEDAEKEVEAIAAELRRKGAQRWFLVGHSQGGVFALHAAGRLRPDGAVAVAPGGSSDAQIMREKLGGRVDEARRLHAEGKGDDTREFADHESSKGVYPVTTTARRYLGWFDPDGAMNLFGILSRLPQGMPVLLVVPTGDFRALLRMKQPTFEALPKHPLTRLLEPASDHRRAPVVAADDIAKWLREAANATK